MINKEYKMNLNEWLETTEFTTKDLELLPSVGCVINTKNNNNPLLPAGANDVSRIVSK